MFLCNVKRLRVLFGFVNTQPPWDGCLPLRQQNVYAINFESTIEPLVLRVVGKKRVAAYIVFVRA